MDPTKFWKKRYLEGGYRNTRTYFCMAIVTACNSSIVDMEEKNKLVFEDGNCIAILRQELAS